MIDMILMTLIGPAPLLLPAAATGHHQTNVDSFNND